MNFIVLLNGVKAFKYANERYYIELVLLKHEMWENLDSITAETVKNVVIEFLNKWGRCRRHKRICNSLRETLQGLSKYSSVLLNKSLLNLNFNEKVGVNGESKKVSELIEETFDKLKSIDYMGATATSKTLHGINPQLFMIWDENIRLGYGYKENSVGYLNFMIECQYILGQIVNGYCRERDRDMDAAIKEISEQAYPKLEVKKPLTKLLDEYNYMRFTQGRPLPNPHLFYISQKQK